ncbi:MAG: PQQ-dependent sugar dehydrogenase [Saprospiraceae bacterium]
MNSKSILQIAVIFLTFLSCNTAQEPAKSSGSTQGMKAEGLRSNESEAALDPMYAAAKANYINYCSGCHGVQMDAFVDRKWKYGNKKEDLIKGIEQGYLDDGMPAYDTTFTDKEVEDLASFILEGIKNLDRYSFSKKPDPNTVFKAEDLSYRLETVTTGVDVPWGMTFLPNGDMLITDRNGKLYRQQKAGKLQPIGGVPAVAAEGQGGLLDIELHPKFAENNWLYISYSKPHDTESGKATTAIMRATLQGNALVEQKLLFEALPYSTRRHHYGSRLEFDKKGYLYFSVGDRGDRDNNPQNLDNHCGKIHRIHDDGRIPKDNPFINTPGAMPSIYSYGHRNPQGVAMNPATGDIWENEHGPRGGDEVNIIAKGKNYGWPVISYGINYNATTFTEKTEQEGMEQPVLYWIPSIGACGMTFVTGDRYPGWKGAALVGSLRFQYLNLCKVVGNKIVKEELLLPNIGRLRSVEMGNDGYIYVGVESPGTVYRLVPLAD